MDPFLSALAGIVMPGLAIIVSTVLAVWLARRERRDSEKSLRRERLLAAAMPLFEDLASFVTLDPHDEDMRPTMRAMRAHTAGFRAALDARDALVSDWVAFRHRECMSLQRIAMEAPTPDHVGESGAREWHEAAWQRARAQPNETIQMLQGWLSGDVTTQELKRDGARIIKEFGSG